MKPRRGTLGLLLLGCIGGASLGLSVYEKDFLMSSAGRQREESSKLVRRRGKALVSRVDLAFHVISSSFYYKR